MPSETPFQLVIVDDHELLATVLAMALRPFGWDVEIVAGPTADVVVATVRRLAPVLVLLDLELGPPLGSGLDLIQPLIAVGGRVVMMTGVQERARLGACVEVGAAGILSKTDGFEALVDAVGRAVHGEEILNQHDRARLLEDLRAQRGPRHARSSPPPRNPFQQC